MLAAILLILIVATIALILITFELGAIHHELAHPKPAQPPFTPRLIVGVSVEDE